MGFNPNVRGNSIFSGGVDLSSATPPAGTTGIGDNDDYSNISGGPTLKDTLLALDAASGGGGGGSASGAFGDIQLSDGSGNFVSDANFNFTNGRLRIDGNDVNSFRAFSTAGVNEAFFGRSASANEAFVITKWAASYTDLHIYGATTNHIVLTNDGKTGIGSIPNGSEASVLQVFGGTNTNVVTVSSSTPGEGQFSMGSLNASYGNATFIQSSNGIGGTPLRLNVQGGDVLISDGTGGKVGIGTLTPSQPLHVYSSAEPPSGGLIALFDTGAGNNYLKVSAGTAQFIQGVDRDTRGFFGMLSGHPLSVRTSNVERINIDENGHVNVVNTLNIQGNIKLRYTTNSGQSLVNTGGNNQIIVFTGGGSAEYDNSAGAFDTGTGVFTAPRDGYYQVQSTVTIDHSTESGDIILDFVVNGTEVARGQRINVLSGGTTGVHASDIFFLSAGSTLSVRIRNETSGTVELEAYGPSNFIAISELP